MPVYQCVSVCIVICNMCVSVFMGVCAAGCVSLYGYLCNSVYQYGYFCNSVYLTLWVSVHQSVYLYVWVSVYQCVYLSVLLFVYMFASVSMFHCVFLYTLFILIVSGCLALST